MFSHSSNTKSEKLLPFYYFNPQSLGMYSEMEINEIII